MAKLQFLKKITYTSEIEGMEDMKITITAHENQKKFLEGSRVAKEIGDSDGTDPEVVDKMKRLVEFVSSYVEKIENLTIEEDGKEVEITDMKPLLEVKGLHFNKVLPIVIEAFRNIASFGQVSKKK